MKQLNDILSKFNKNWKSACEVEYKDKTYIIEGQSEHSNRLLDIVPNYNNPDENGNYYFEMTDNAIDYEGNEYRAVWIFNTEDIDMEDMSNWDWDKVYNIEEY